MRVRNTGGFSLGRPQKFQRFHIQKFNRVHMMKFQEQSRSVWQQERENNHHKTLAEHFSSERSLSWQKALLEQ